MRGLLIYGEVEVWLLQKINLFNQCAFLNLKLTASCR